MPAPLDPLPIRAAVREAAERLRDGGKPNAQAEAREIVGRALGLSRAELVGRSAPGVASQGVASEDLAEINAVLERRLAGEPLDSIIGEREFFGRLFRVTPDVLSPREDTEALVRATLAALDGVETPRVLELGLGSGAVAITLLAERPDMSVMGVDISPFALLVGENNAVRHGVADRLDLAEGSWFEPVEGRFDAVVSNPPYITDAAMRTLEREVRDFDPALALAGGPDGLDAFRVIAGQARAHLEPGAPLLLEIGYDLGAGVAALLARAGFADVRVTPDLAGHDRVVIARTLPAEAAETVVDDA